MNELRSLGVPIAPGLSEAEFSAIESSHRFQFPPDLRSILREGLPISPSFPNWRSSAIPLSLPVSSLLHHFSLFRWPPAWGPRPDSHSQSFAIARSILSRAPHLIPVYRHFYIAAQPNLAGNPLFYVRGALVRCCGFDLADFYRRQRICSSSPVWAAKEPRRVEVWSDLASLGGEREVLSPLEEFMREMGRRLREGGWGEKEVREMIGSSAMEISNGDRDRLIQIMLRAGWTKEDVAYAMGLDFSSPSDYYN